MKKVLLLIFLIFSILSCSDKKDGGNKHKDTQTTNIKVSVDDRQSIKCSRLFQSTQLIPLETNEQSLLDNIQKIIPDSEGKIYVSTSKSVSVFDSEGKFIHKINNVGKGPGEYLQIDDFLIDEQEGYIEILDMRGRKIVRYDLSGKYVDQWETKMQSMAFTKINTSTYALYNSNNITEESKYKLEIRKFNTNKSMGQYLKIQDNHYQYLFIVNYINFSHFNNTIHFFYPENDTIYKINKEGKITPGYAIDFGSNNMPENFIDKEFDNIIQFDKEFKKRGYASFIDYFYETNSWIIFKFKSGEMRYLCLHNKSTKETKIINKIKEDINFNSIYTKYLKKPFHIKNNKVYYLIQPHNFIETIEKIRNSLPNSQWGKYKNNHSELIQLYKTMNYSDNPIIAIYKLKDKRE